MRNHISLRAHDAEQQLEKALKRALDPIQKMRLKAIILRKQGNDPQEIAERLLISDRAVRAWITLYNEKGVAGLAPKPPGRNEGNPKWDTSIFDTLAREIDKGGYWSIPKMQEWIKAQHKEDIPEQTVWYHINKLKYSYKSARPHPVLGNQERQAAFKKGASHHSWSR